MANEPITAVASAHLHALALIQRERAEQANRHGYDADHDDRHDGGELVHAAVAFAAAAEPLTVDFGILGDIDLPADQIWPWNADDNFRPLDNSILENLVKAAALLLADIERRIRAEGSR